MVSLTQTCEELEKYREDVYLSLQEVTELDLACKYLLHRYLSDFSLIDKDALLKIQGIIDYMYERINIGNWKEVKEFLRKTITIASYLKLVALLKVSDKNPDEILSEGFKIIDFGIIFGCPLSENPVTLLQKCATILNSANAEKTVCYEVPPSCKVDNNQTETEYKAIPLKILDCPSMEYLYKNYILPEKPVVLENCVNHWPALTKWKDINYFIKLAGLRTVSIELGSQYTDTEWTQKLMTLEEFIKNHILDSSGPTGYLAQYHLFDHIPELKKDIAEPEYCCFTEGNDPVDVMAWYGPKGTVSPLHHDPKRNFLTQVVGEKQIFLFSPQDSEYLYPHEHELLNNTAQIDPRQPDLEKFPKYKDAKPFYCKLKPGQMLYIPPKWWHFVESLSLSFSVSFWWE